MRRQRTTRDDRARIACDWVRVDESEPRPFDGALVDEELFLNRERRVDLFWGRSIVLHAGLHEPAPIPTNTVGAPSDARAV